MRNREAEGRKNQRQLFQRQVYPGRLNCWGLNLNDAECFLPTLQSMARISSPLPNKKVIRASGMLKAA